MSKKLRLFQQHELEQLRRIDETWNLPLIKRAVSRLVELHDEAANLRSCLQSGRMPVELHDELKSKVHKSDRLLTKYEVMQLVIEWLFMEEAGND